MEAGAARNVSDFVKGMEKRKIHSDAELASLGKSLVVDGALIGAISEYLFTFLHTQSNGDKEHGLLGRLYAQLLRCLRSSNSDLMSFVAQLLMPLIWRHLDDCYGPQEAVVDPEADGPTTDDLIIACYNTLILDEKGHSKTVTYVIPDLTVPSVYHDPSEFSTLLLQKNYLEANKDHIQQPLHKDVILRLSDQNFVGPVDKLTRRSRWTLFRALMRYLGLSLVKCTKACHQNVVNFGQKIYGTNSPEEATHKTVILRGEAIKIAKEIAKQGEFILQPSIVLLANAVVARGEARGGAEDDTDKLIVPPIKCFGGLEHRALLQTTSSLRWKKVVDIPIILKPGEERSYREGDQGKEAEAAVDVARKSGGRANYEEDEEDYEENVKRDQEQGIVDPTS